MRPTKCTTISFISVLTFLSILILPLLAIVRNTITITDASGFLNPLVDIDLTTSTDFEDSFILVVESFEMFFQDIGLFVDGGFSLGTSFWSSQKQSNFAHLR